MNTDKDLSQYVAVKAVVKNSQGEVLVLQQSNEAQVDGAGRYHLPGGIVEPGESLETALKREVLEEAGLEIKATRLLAVEEWRTTIRGEKCQFFGIFYECQASNDEVKLDQQEAINFVWLSLDNLDKVDVLKPSRGVIERALKT